MARPALLVCIVGGEVWHLFLGPSTRKGLSRGRSFKVDLAVAAPEQPRCFHAVHKRLVVTRWRRGPRSDTGEVSFFERLARRLLESGNLMPVRRQE